MGRPHYKKGSKSVPLSLKLADFYILYYCRLYKSNSIVKYGDGQGGAASLIFDFWLEEIDPCYILIFDGTQNVREEVSTYKVTSLELASQSSAEVSRAVMRYEQRRRNLEPG